MAAMKPVLGPFDFDEHVSVFAVCITHTARLPALAQECFSRAWSGL